MFIRIALCLAVLCVACEKKQEDPATPVPKPVVSTPSAPAKQPEDQSFPVHYDRTFKEAWLGARINSIADNANDGAFKKQEVEFGNVNLTGKKFTFLTPMTCGAVADYMASAHYRPATYTEQMAYMEAFPGERFEGSFVIIGTIWEHDTTEEKRLIHLRDFLWVDAANTIRDLRIDRCNNPIGASAIFFGIKIVKR